MYLLGVAGKGDSGALNGWAVFAATILIISGVLDVFYGIAALSNDQIITASGTGQGVIIWDFTTWGWISIVLGAILALTGLALLSGSGVARVLAIIFCIFAAIAQVGLITVFPLWSILLVILFVMAAYNLSVKGVDAY